MVSTLVSASTKHALAFAAALTCRTDTYCVPCCSPSAASACMMSCNSSSTCWASCVLWESIASRALLLTCNMKPILQPGDAASNAWVSSEQLTSFSCMDDTVWVRLESTDRQVSKAVRWAARCFIGCKDASRRHWKSGWLTKVQCLLDVKHDVACRLLTIVDYVSSDFLVPLLPRAMISLRLPNEDTGARPSAFLLHNIGQEGESKDSKRRR